MSDNLFKVEQHDNNQNNNDAKKSKEIKRIDKIKEFNVDVTQTYFVFGVKDHMTFHLQQFYFKNQSYHLILFQFNSIKKYHLNTSFLQVSNFLYADVVY